MARAVARTGHVPHRTCIACGRPQAKGELIRLVRVGPEQVNISHGGRVVGRGAYVCPSCTCWQEAFKKGRLERALRVSLSASVREQLQGQGLSLVRQAKMEDESRG
ncbi:MAG: YlxR family protein [Chloroflexi bacterium]|nr:YlxR family protein [Chloroflexota bacterium]